MNQKRLFSIAIVIILVFDLWAWYTTYRIATEPSPEAVQLGLEK